VAHALGRHIVVVGYMGAGKSTVGAEVARRLGRPFLDVDRIVEDEHGGIQELFAARGEAAFRELEASAVQDACGAREPSVIAVGGGAVETPGLFDGLGALVVALEVDVDTAWARVRGSGRPLAQDESEFRRRYDVRAPLYEHVADVRATDVDGVVLAAAGVRLCSRPEAPGSATIADARVAELHGVDAAHLVVGGESAKTVAEAEQLWRSLVLDRGSTLVGVGGGSTTDLVGFVAATYLRGVPWIAVPSTLVGQVDAGIGGKVGIHLPEAKNLVGAFHWPVETTIDTTLLETLPEEEWANGLAEVVKTGLLAGEPLWKLETSEQVRGCAAFKAAVCLRDPLDRGERVQLNLGHTFAHALEAASGYRLPHGRAVALGLLAALRLSGLDDEVATVDELLAPRPVHVDREAAWSALQRDKKAAGGRVRLVLLERPGSPRLGVELPPKEIRAALDGLIE
jgi:3-dehydroquinate synthetase/shikimate kinase